jgi:hypothetical protein
MGNRFASGKYSIAECDRCAQRYKLKELKGLVIKTKNVNILVCPECWEEDQPQLQLGMYPVDDPQAVRNPRPDFNAYYQSGVNGVRTSDTATTSEAGYGVSEGGSRMIQWGWYPVGGASANDAGLTPNNLVSNAVLGTVTVTTT